MLTLYQKGVESLNFCSQKLNEFEDKITIINKDVNNELNPNDSE